MDFQVFLLSMRGGPGGEQHDNIQVPAGVRRASDNYLRTKEVYLA